MTPWNNRIVGEGNEKPDQLLANPNNWRIHPEQQQLAVQASLSSIGWVSSVIVNQPTGHIIDGHLRVMLAMRHHEQTIPVLYVELDADEEAAALASLDTITGMAKGNAFVFEQLLEHIGTGEAELMDFLERKAQELGIYDEEKTRDYDNGTEIDGDSLTFKHECPCCQFGFN